MAKSITNDEVVAYAERVAEVIGGLSVMDGLAVLTVVLTKLIETAPSREGAEQTIESIARTIRGSMAVAPPKNAVKH